MFLIQNFVTNFYTTETSFRRFPLPLPLPFGVNLEKQTKQCYHVNYYVLGVPITLGTLTLWAETYVPVLSTSSQSPAPCPQPLMPTSSQSWAPPRDHDAGRILRAVWHGRCRYITPNEAKPVRRVLTSLTTARSRLCVRGTVASSSLAVAVVAISSRSNEWAGRRAGLLLPPQQVGTIAYY
jgi:hypothetical protein